MLLLGSVLDGIFRDAVLSILATIAKQERIRRTERASAAIARLRRNGQADRLGRKRNVFDRDRALRLRADGWSLRAIAEELGQSPMTIQRAVAAS
jgi:DNA invertase Pin-like site-specific DNA recombinase